MELSVVVLFGVAVAEGLEHELCQPLPGPGKFFQVHAEDVREVGRSPDGLAVLESEELSQFGDGEGHLEGTPATHEPDLTDLAAGQVVQGVGGYVGALEEEVWWSRGLKIL